ncbi:Endoplasmic reticulum membrane protein 65 [Golovinomyces cichoracearum]|uniref:Endoplasmic reticulum membrane protein 65 n=1 Tax=Golovinomyces cichoracearum TaxID=62708 RepID=A0A420IVB4_9PEZI|nr:Endoplasmic reticulum membrane protein 65 [Golovinomyces cichoracearum]
MGEVKMGRKEGSTELDLDSGEDETSQQHNRSLPALNLDTCVGEENVDEHDSSISPTTVSAKSSVENSRAAPDNKGCAKSDIRNNSSENYMIDNAGLNSLQTSSVSQVEDPVNFPKSQVEISNTSSGPKTEKNDKICKMNEAGLNQTASAADLLSLASSSSLSPFPLHSLAPSPTFKPKSLLGYISPDSEENDIRSRRVTEFDISVASKVGSSLTSKKLDSPTPKRELPFRTGVISNPPNSPTALNRLRKCSKAIPNLSSSKRSPEFRPEGGDSRFSSKKINENKSTSPSPMLSSMSIPIPPLSIPTFLQLELSSTGPPPLYIYRPSGVTYPFESTKTKFQRLLNFVILPPKLEQALLFGSFVCLDAWLHTFTILPLRFFKAVGILGQWYCYFLTKEVSYISKFIYEGLGRMWCRQRKQVAPLNTLKHASRARASTLSSIQSQASRIPQTRDQRRSFESMKTINERKLRQGRGRQNHTNLQPKILSSQNKADLLQGILIFFSCVILMKLDASRMYHYIRGQAAIKLYVIFNVLEVCDKLLAALGQDIFECLFTNDNLQHDSSYGSTPFQTFWMFLLALIYNICHTAALFFQVITLNVAVNSYSNALFTLLMSNQFVEIKSTVFKKIEKDNLFQLLCADVVERFQLCIILIIIGLRNFIEMGGLSVPSGDMNGNGEGLKDANSPLRNNSILPNSFSLLPSWTGEILSPFFFVLGSELLIDWIKHSYISKFNNVKPTIYGHYLDILSKDYYLNAFRNQNLVKRFGLPVIPLACLFIRSSVQTYHMFLTTYLSTPLSVSDLSPNSAVTSPATIAALKHFDTHIRRALGRSTFGIPDPNASNPWYLPSTDDMIAALTMVVFFLGAFLVLLAFKIVLGMFLLRFARNRYQSMRFREHQSYDTDGKRIGAWGMTEVDDDKKRWIYQDEPETLAKFKERQKISREKTATSQDFSKIGRYDMLKRIW